MAPPTSRADASRNSGTGREARPAPKGRAARAAQLDAAALEAKAARREARRRRRRQQWMIFSSVVAGLAVLGGLGYYELVFVPAHASTSGDDTLPNVNNSSLTPPVTIVPGGTTYQLAPNQHSDSGFTLLNRSLLTGAFQASVAVKCFLLTASQYSAFLSNTSSFTWVWATGATTSATLQNSLGPGSYEIVFWNANAAKPTTVVVLATIQASAT